MINIKAATWSLALFTSVTYLICVAYGLLVPESLHMAPFLEQVLPGFRWLTPGGFVIGLAEAFLYGAYVGLVFGPIYNWCWKRWVDDPVREDIQRLESALKRFCLPRSVTLEQIESIGTYLMEFEPFPVTFVVRRFDREAGDYRIELERALREAGWGDLTLEYSSDVEEGLTIHFRQTPEMSELLDDERSPKPDRVLHHALRHAGVQVEATGRELDREATESVLSICVGARRRDSHGHM